MSVIWLKLPKDKVKALGDNRQEINPTNSKKPDLFVASIFRSLDLTTAGRRAALLLGCLRDIREKYRGGPAD